MKKLSIAAELKKRKIAEQESVQKSVNTAFSAFSESYDKIESMADTIADLQNCLEECHAINMRQYGSIDAVKNAAHVTPGGIMALLISQALERLKARGHYVEVKK